MLTQEALDFLVENQLTDSKIWFEEHRADYERLVREPMFEVIDRVCEVLAEEIEPEIMRDHKRALSRIRRDTRFSRDKTKYRANFWAMFTRDKRIYEYHPGFFFELRPDGAMWGAGMYFADERLQDSYRGMVLDRRPEFLEAKAAYEAQDVFIFDPDDAYKRTKYPNEPEDVRVWLDRKSIYMIHNEEPEAAFVPDLADRLIRDFRLVYPYYRFLIAASDGAVRPSVGV